MSDPDTAAAVADIIAEELAEVTPAMIEAASRVEGDLLVRMVPQDQRFRVIWNAMLAAKLREIA